MEITKMILGQMQTNAYIMVNELKEAVLVDPGDEAERISEYIEEKKLKLKAILITHGHFDHIGAVDALRQGYDVKVYAHACEADMMEDVEKNLSNFFGMAPKTARATDYVQHNQIINIAKDLVFQCIEIPGHTEHSICYYHPDGYLIAGDTLFNDTIGRTDLYEGDSRDLKDNILNVLFKLPESTKVYPGHGLTTTIEKEKKYNIHLKGY